MLKNALFCCNIVKIAKRWWLHPRPPCLWWLWALPPQIPVGLWWLKALPLNSHHEDSWIGAWWCHQKVQKITRNRKRFVFIDALHG